MRCRCAFTWSGAPAGLARAVERGTAGIEFLLSFMLFNVVPTLFEIAVVCAILWRLYDWTFAAVTLATIVAYIAFTFVVTEWRIRFRREMNTRNTEANTKAVDSLLNYETVKYFANEAHEARALRPRAAGLRARRGQERDDAGGAQCRPGRDHRRRPDRGDDPGGHRASWPGG